MVGGDLRVTHFVGQHGMQALPILAWLLLTSGLRRRLSEARRARLMIVAGVAYLRGAKRWTTEKE